MKDPLIAQLAAVGLGDHEAAVYATLVSHSPASAAFTAKKLGISRSTVYTALDRLVAKGLVGTTYKNEVKQFIASPASSIDDLLRREEAELRERRKVFDALSDHLDLLRRTDAGLPSIVFFEGQESLKKIYLGMLREAPKGAIMRIMRDEFIWGKEWEFVFSKEWNDKVRRLRTEKNVDTRLLVNDSAKERSHAGTYRGRPHLAVRTVPKKQALDRFVVYVLGGTVSILSMAQDDLVGIRIANPHIAKNFASVFDAMWTEGKPLK